MGWLETEWSEGLTHEAGRSDVGLASGNIESIPIGIRARDHLWRWKSERPYELRSEATLAEQRDAGR